MSKILGAHTATLPLKNLIINGDMFIDQRNSGNAISAANTDNKYLIDRWLTGNSQSSKFNSGQNQLGFTAPNGFSKYLNMNCISTVSLAAGDYFFLSQRVEGVNTSSLAWGTNSAKNITLSFWVRSSTAGTFGGAVGNTSSTRSYPFIYTINAINTFEYKTVTIPGDTTGTWPNNNTIGLIVYFGLGVGTTLSGPAGAWAGANYVSATGATSVVTSGQNWNLTGVQITEGSVAIDFRTFSNASPSGELAACQRYFEKSTELGTSVTGGAEAGLLRANHGNNAAGIHGAQAFFKTEKRTTPTVSYYDMAGTSGVVTTEDQGATRVNNIALNSVTYSQNDIFLRLFGQTVSGFVAHWTADAEL